MPLNIGPNQMALGSPIDPNIGAKYIRTELVPNIDLNPLSPVGQYDLVVDADWYAPDVGFAIRGIGNEFDLSQIMRAGGMRSIQSVYIDNLAGNGCLSLLFLGSNQRISCPPSSAGWFAVIAPFNDGKIRIGYDDKYNINAESFPSWMLPSGALTPGGNRVAPVPYNLTMYFTDLAVPPFVWEARQMQAEIADFSGSIPLAGVDTPIGGGPGCKRVSMGVRADTVNLGFILIGIESNRTGTVNYFWGLAPGESLVFQGKSTPLDEMFLQATVDGDFYSCFLGL